MKRLLLKTVKYASTLFYQRPGQRKIINNLALVVLSLVMAYFLWLIAMFTVMTMQAINIPILITNAPPNASVRIESPASQNINVMVNIPKNLVQTVNPSNFIFQLDLGNISSQITSLETVQEFPISPLDVKIINLPGLITISEVTPRSIRLRISYHNKQVPIQVNVEGEPLEGFYLDEEEVSTIPKEVTVVAPQRILQDMEYIQTFPINITGRSSSFTQNVALNIPANTEIFDHARQVEAFIPIQEEILEEQISAVPVRLERLNEDFITTVEPSEVTVTVRGPQSLVPQLTREDLSIVLVVPDEEGTFGKEVRPFLSEDLPERMLEQVTIVSSEPGSVVIENVLPEEEEAEEPEEEENEIEAVEISPDTEETE